MARYVPPKQSKLSQLFDVVVLLALTFGALYTPLYLGLAGGSKTAPEIVDPTWESLGQNATQIAQYKALGFTDAAKVAPIIGARYDYSFSWTCAHYHVPGHHRLLRHDTAPLREGISRGHRRKVRRCQQAEDAMSYWIGMEYAAWALSAAFGLYIVIDWLRTDAAYPEEVLTSSREGEIEAMTEEHRI